jgi:hypothetical protein
MSQEEFAELCQIPTNTIKSIEVGRLALTPTVSRNVAEATGARWDDKRHRWARFNDNTAFTFEDYAEYRHKLRNPSSLDQSINQGTVAQIHCRIEWLFEHVPAESREILRSRVEFFLEQCKRDFNLTKDDALFYRPWLSSGKDYSLFMNLAQQKLQRVPSVRGLHGVAGNKKRKRLY